jgi:hypothetical protein
MAAVEDSLAKSPRRVPQIWLDLPNSMRFEPLTFWNTDSGHFVLGFF